MLGFNGQQNAVNAYKSNYQDGFPVGPVTAMSMDEFKTWVENGDTTKPLNAKHFDVADPASTEQEQAKRESKPLSEIKITDQFQVEGTDESVTVIQTADKMLAEIDSRIDGMKSLIHCLGRAA